MPLYALMLAQPHQRLVHLALYCTLTLQKCFLCKACRTALQHNESLALWLLLRVYFRSSRPCFSAACCLRLACRLHPPPTLCCAVQARRLLDSPAFFAAGAALYSVLLLAWLRCGALGAALAALRACSPLPSVGRVAAAFLQPEATTLAWLHLLLLDLFQARWSPATSAAAH